MKSMLRAGGAWVFLGLGTVGWGAEAWDLPAAVAQALAENPQSGLARERIAGAAALVQQAQAAYWPQVGLSADYAQTTVPMMAFGAILNQGAFSPTMNFNAPGQVDNLRVAAEVRYRLFEGGARRAALGAARAGQAAAEFSDEAVRQSLGAAVVQAWFGVRQAEEALASHRAAVEAYTASLTVAQAKRQAGTFLPTEVLNLEVQLAQARENEVTSRHGLELARRALLHLMGRTDQTLVLAPADDPHLPAEPASLDPSQRPELRAIREQEKMARFAFERARAGRLPTVDAFGSAEWNRGWDLAGEGDAWTAGLRVSYDLFDGRLTTGRIAEALAGLRQAEEQVRAQELAVDFEVQRARLLLAQARERLTVTDKMVVQAEESAALSRARFEQGVLLSSELIDVETRLTEARMRRAVAHAQERIALAELRRAVGLPAL